MHKYKKIFLVSLFVFSNLVSCFIGAMLSKKYTRDGMSISFDVANASMQLTHYAAFRDIALLLRSNDSIRATCVSEFHATALSDFSDCLSDVRCKMVFERTAKILAPEVVGLAPTPFPPRQNCPKPDEQKSVNSKNIK